MRDVLSAFAGSGINNITVSRSVSDLRIVYGQMLHVTHMLYSPIHAEGILDVRLAVCTSHIGARKCADHESHLIILKTSAP